MSLPVSAAPATRGNGHGQVKGPSPGPDPIKRRKIRKGTRSCWECKRRKIRCRYDAPTDDICVGCRQRGARCVGQEFPEEVSPAAGRGQLVGDRIVRVEALIEQLARQVGSGTTQLLTPEGNLSADSVSPFSRRSTVTSSYSDVGNAVPIRQWPSSRSSVTSDHEFRDKGDDENGRDDDDNDIDDDDDHYSRTPWPKQFGPAGRLSLPSRPPAATATAGRFADISKALYAALPSQTDLDIIVRAHGHDHSIFIPFVLYMPYEVLETEGLRLSRPSDLLDIAPYGPDTHPVLLAKKMLIIASFLQYLDLDFDRQNPGLSEPTRAMMLRLTDKAINLVTTNDELLGWLEALECILIECFWQANQGNVRRSWLACRRAMVVGQLLGVHRTSFPGPSQALKVLDPQNTKPFPAVLWFRTVMPDRSLSLMLGLPQGSLDVSFGLDPDKALFNNTPVGRFERAIWVVATDIVERNNAADRDEEKRFALTLKIDHDLQRAANSMPAQFWLMPTIGGLAGTSQDAVFWDFVRLVQQLTYYSILAQAHHPFMLRTSPGESHKFDYSRNTCVNASRELLTRFIAFRNIHAFAARCRYIDFFALMAALTLSLAHIDLHSRPSADNFLIHQRLGDLAMMQQVVELMDDGGRLNDDAMMLQSAELLRTLLAIEAEAATADQPCSAQGQNLCSEARSGQSFSVKEDGVWRMHVPYFGTVRIARGGLISRESEDLTANEIMPSTPWEQQEASSTSIPFDNRANLGSEHVTHNLATQMQLDQTATQPRMLQNLVNTAASPSPSTTPFAPQFPTIIADTIRQQYPYPELTAGVEDWAFQGVDLAFFDSVMR